jgi:hypothetical protein
MSVSLIISALESLKIKPRMTVLTIGVDDLEKRPIKAALLPSAESNIRRRKLRSLGYVLLNQKGEHSDTRLYAGDHKMLAASYTVVPHE